MVTRDWWKVTLDTTAWIEVDFRVRGDNRIAADVEGVIGLTQYVWKMKIYRPAELDNFLHQAGFALIEWYGDWRGRPLCEDSPHIIAVATKS
jgi:hypothetical protein